MNGSADAVMRATFFGFGPPVAMRMVSLAGMPFGAAATAGGARVSAFCGAAAAVATACRVDDGRGEMLLAATTWVASAGGGPIGSPARLSGG